MGLITALFFPELLKLGLFRQPIYYLLNLQQVVSLDYIRLECHVYSMVLAKKYNKHYELYQPRIVKLTHKHKTQSND